MSKSIKVMYRFIKANTKFSAFAVFGLIVLLPALVDFLFAT